MKTFDFDWTTFIDHMPAWASLSMPCREFFLFQCETQRRIPLRDIGVDLTPLLDVGFLEHAANPAYVKIRRACLPSHRIMRFMARHSLFATGNAQPEDLQAYLEEAFSKSDQFALCDRYSSPVRRVSQVSWLDTFLRAGSFRVWEAMHKPKRRTTHTLFESEDCFWKTKEIVKALMQGANPLTFSDLCGVVGGAELARYAAAIRAGIAYALLFPSVHKTDLLPVIGIWPGIHARLHRPKMQRPGAAKTEEKYHRAYLMDDMTALLVACAGKPVRLRQFETELYADDAKKVETNLEPLPAWLKPRWPRGDTSRVETARQALACMELTETVCWDHRDWQVPSKRGRQWLVRCQQERLRTVLDTLRELAEKETKQDYPFIPGLHLMPLCQPRVYVASRPSNMMLFLKRAWDAPPTGRSQSL